jgi:hypothetical protein
MMGYFIPSERVWKPLRYMWVGWYAFLFESISVSTGFLDYNMDSVNFKWYVSFFQDPNSYIPVAAMTWIFYVGIQIWIAIDLFNWIKSKTNDIGAYLSCISISIILAIILNYMYVVITPLIGL